MGELVEKLQKKVELKREAVDTKVQAVIPRFEAALMEALDKMVSKVVLDQSEHTNSKDPAELGTLKANLANAAIQARSSVAARLEGLEIDRLAKGVRVNSKGNSFVFPADVLNPLLQSTGDLLRKAGYDVRVLIGNSFETKYRLSTIRDLSGDVDVAARELDAAIEEYGHAVFELNAAQVKESKADAKSAWDKA